MWSMSKQGSGVCSKLQPKWGEKRENKVEKKSNEFTETVILDISRLISFVCDHDWSSKTKLGVSNMIGLTCF